MATLPASPSSQLKDLLTADGGFLFSEPRPSLPRLVGQITSQRPTKKASELTCPNYLRRSARPSPTLLRLRPLPGLSSRKGVRPSFQSPNRRQWRAHYPTGRCPAISAAFFPPHGTGTLQPQRVLGTMCCRLRLRRLRRRRRHDTSRPCAVMNEMMTGLSTTKLGF